MSFPLSRFVFSLSLSLFALVAGVAHAQALPAGVRLGMSADELRSTVSALERVSRPQRLAGGLVGSWHAAPVMMAGLMFEPTFFFAGAELRRVEYVATLQGAPEGGAAAFGELVQWGRSAFGNELASRDPGNAYAAWVSSDTDIYVQHVSNPQRGSVRLVYKSRQLRDGSEL